MALLVKGLGGGNTSIIGATFDSRALQEAEQKSERDMRIIDKTDQKKNRTTKNKKE